MEAKLKTKRCTASTQDGRPCRAYALVGSSFCFWHDPGSAPARDVARRLGGGHRSSSSSPSLFAGLDLKKPNGLLSLTEALIQQTCTLPNSANRARVLGYLMLAQRRLIDLDLLAGRVDALERVLMRRKVPEE